MAISILALDLATKTGWAYNQHPGRNLSGVQDLSLKRGESPGTVFLRFDRWLHESIGLMKPDVIAYELAHHRGGAATALAEGLISHVKRQCAGAGIEFMHCHTATLKKFATGRGNASKQEMVNAFCRRWGREPIDDNEADAMWLLEWAKKEVGIPCPP